MGIVIMVLIIGAAVFFALTYNSLIQLKNQVKNAWSQIDVQLKRRHDLIPNLVEIAKGYMSHEKETLENVIKARNMAISAGNVKEKGKAENFLSGTLKSLFAVSENYPNLKADQQMLALQEELTTTENKISFARQFYNDETTRFNTKLEMFPTNMMASMFNFQKEDLFEFEDVTEREAPKVKFS